jgi:hypothetical protein
MGATPRPTDTKTASPEWLAKAGLDLGLVAPAQLSQRWKAPSMTRRATAKAASIVK